MKVQNLRFCLLENGILAYLFWRVHYFNGGASETSIGCIDSPLRQLNPFNRWYMWVRIFSVLYVFEWKAVVLMFRAFRFGEGITILLRLSSS